MSVDYAKLWEPYPVELDGKKYMIKRQGLVILLVLVFHGLQ